MGKNKRKNKNTEESVDRTKKEDPKEETVEESKEEIRQPVSEPTETPTESVQELDAEQKNKLFEELEASFVPQNQDTSQAKEPMDLLSFDTTPATMEAKVEQVVAYDDPFAEAMIEQA